MPNTGERIRYERLTEDGQVETFKRAADIARADFHHSVRRLQLSGGSLREIARFWGMGDRFAQHGFLHRRGYLFYGKQGSGKSSLATSV